MRARQRALGQPAVRERPRSNQKSAVRHLTDSFSQAGAKTGQAERDFFAHGLCTQLTRKVPTAAQPALRAFEKYSKYPLALGLSEFATLDEDGCDLSGGCEELGATFPWALHLHPRVNTPPLPDGAPNTAFVDALLATVSARCRKGT